MKILKNIYQKFFGIKINSTTVQGGVDIYSDSIYRYTEGEYDRDYVNVQGNVQRYYGIMQGQYDDIFRYDNVDLGNPRIRRMADSLSGVVYEAKKYILQNRNIIESMVSYVYMEHVTFIGDLTQDIRMLSDITQEINSSFYSVLSLVYYRKRELEVIREYVNN